MFSIRKTKLRRERKKANEGRRNTSHWFVSIDQSASSIVSTTENERNSLGLTFRSFSKLFARLRFVFSDQSEMKISFAFVLLLLLRTARSNEEKYDEELYIRPLATGETYFNLLFTTVASPSFLQSKSSSFFVVHRGKSFVLFSSPVQHYSLFPKLIADVVRSEGVDEFHVSLTQGLWRYERWGMPIVGAPPGAELWAWFQPNDEQSVAKRWTSFVHQLGGLFCASFNFIDSNVSSTSPHFSFRSQSTRSRRNASLNDDSLLRYAVLPREIVCTGSSRRRKAGRTFFSPS